MFKDTSIEGIDEVMERSWSAFLLYRNYSLVKRAEFMKAIASNLENSGDDLIRVAMKETNLPEARLKNERARTVFQLNNYADACMQGTWLEARIDSAIPDRNPPRPDIRKMNIGIGPVIVFGSSNFPFAYSTVGGDSASALAAGCPVIVKAHPAHAETSTLVAELVDKAAAKHNMPKGIFQHVYGASFEVGRALVMHTHTRAVGFTGSFAGGKQLYDWAQERKEPIPVFAEMGSINPVFLLPEKLQQDAELMAEQLAGSITLGVGQFCTNPGLIIAVSGEDLDRFTEKLSHLIGESTPAKMLHRGISSAYAEKRDTALLQADVDLVAVSSTESLEAEGRPTIASASGDAFLNNPVLHKEVFGPYSIIVRCSDMHQVTEIAEQLEGQLTATLMALETDMVKYQQLVDAITLKCGRLIMNGVPTGVEVTWSMQHGGPFPATTDSRYTSVGPDAIKRFARPLSFQNFPPSLLPEELKDDNPLNITRIVNGVLK